MTWELHDQDDRSELGRPGGDWQGMRPTFDNPFTWAITLGRIGEISIRMHVLFLVYIAVMLIRAALPSSTATQTPIRPTQMLIAMVSLVVIVLAHELGHCLACRRMRGEADEVLMWPLGGLAFCRPGPRWNAHLVTALGGPLVNIIICILAGAILGLLTGRWMGIAIPNPLTMDGLYAVEVSGRWPHQTLYIVNYISFVLLLFNLLPIFPLDGGRIAQSLIWPRYGYARSMVYAVRIGFVGATFLFIFGAVTGEWMVIGIALFGAFTCYTTQKQLQWSEAALGADMNQADEYALTVHDPKEDEGAAKRTWSEKRAARAALREQQEAQEVDRILGKIAQSGLDSLTRSERSLLERVTQRKRQQR